jgi:hypothetical protein
MAAIRPAGDELIYGQYVAGPDYAGCLLQVEVRRDEACRHQLVLHLGNAVGHPGGSDGTGKVISLVVGSS